MRQVVAVVLLCGGLVMAIGRYYRHVHRRAGSWVIKRSELVMSDPPIVLGRGTYGLVVKVGARPPRRNPQFLLHSPAGQPAWGPAPPRCVRAFSKVF